MMTLTRSKKESEIFWLKDEENIYGIFDCKSGYTQWSMC